MIALYFVLFKYGPKNDIKKITVFGPYCFCLKNFNSSNIGSNFCAVDQGLALCLMTSELQAIVVISVL
jgi:hypothetical protein